MSENIFERSALLIGDNAINVLSKKKVAVFGIGGVGGYVCEGLARTGVCNFDLYDNDVVSVSNINRQIIALHSTIGQYKTDVMKQRINDINPMATVNTYHMFFLPENSDTIDFSQYDYVVDAVDTVSAKLELAVKCKESGTFIISSMGAGNKLDPTKFVVTDIYKTDTCPLARVMRRELKKRGIAKLKVVYSTEEALKPQVPADATETKRRSTPGSLAFIPSVAGLIIAKEVVFDLLK